MSQVFHKESTGELVIAAGDLWVSENLGGVLWIDPATGHRRQIPIRIGGQKLLSVDALTLRRGSICASGAVARPDAQSSYTVTASDATVALDPQTGEVIGQRVPKPRTGCGGRG